MKIYSHTYTFATACAVISEYEQLCKRHAEIWFLFYAWNRSFLHVFHFIRKAQPYYNCRCAVFYTQFIPFVIRFIHNIRYIRYFLFVLCLTKHTSQA